MSRFVLSPRAQSDVDEIWDYTADNWGVTQAENYVRAIQRTIEALALAPRSGRACDEIRAGYFKFAVGSHIVFYRLTASGIDVVRILHRRMDFNRHI